MQKDHFGFTHKSGILMPVSSLPSPYGFGSFGKEAREFVDFLSRTGQTCWQVLPLNPIAYGDSPYQSPASQAGNVYYIDLPQLKAQNLLTQEELQSACYSGTRVDYGWLFQTRYALLRKAYARFTENADYQEFCIAQNSWLEDYALFMALKVHYGYASWTSWEMEHRNYDTAREQMEAFREEMGFWMWGQYVFRTQWQSLHAYANEKGITIIGDMPIYAAHDSMDVWRAPEQFLLKPDGQPQVVAGFPPDGLCPDGQLWGNPIYNWEYMKKDGFSWWIHRIGSALELYDILRIDHFIGFANYYAVPWPSATAHGGAWQKAPGKALFSAVKKALPDMKIIAEDLGIITPNVRALMKYTGFPGMKMLHFAFYEEDSENLPENYTTENCVVYTASHDSDCTVSWGQSQSEETLQRMYKACGVQPGASVVRTLIDCAMGSKANLAMVTLQDYLELDNDRGRMNIPSVAQGNWSWRADPDFDTRQLEERILQVTKKHLRFAENIEKEQSS